MRQLLSVIGVVGLATAAAAAPPPGVTNASIETRSGAAGLRPSSRPSSRCYAGPPGSAGRCRRPTAAPPAAGPATTRAAPAAAAAAWRASAGCDVVGARRRGREARGQRPRARAAARRGRPRLEDPHVLGGLRAGRGRPAARLDRGRPARGQRGAAGGARRPAGERSDERQALDDGALAAIASHADPSADARSSATWRRSSRASSGRRRPSGWACARRARLRGAATAW